MEGEKRKSDPNAALLEGSHKRAREDDNGEETTVTEEEVEEFFAILRRIHVAVNYFKKGNGDIRTLTELGKMESLSSGGNVNVNGGKKNEENVGLDLNADPGSTGKREREADGKVELFFLWYAIKEHRDCTMESTVGSLW